MVKILEQRIDFGKFVQCVVKRKFIIQVGVIQYMIGGGALIVRDL